ncbi:tail protein X [Sphingopyxis sp. NFH-91]|uniref:tail protein X n=1 Tax=Sphingopyxis sp. NFH-91 TaxID=2744457 RepID=UPI001F3009B3|nr:tail protein X [Sphingopyxis sp. NFH-91]
MADLTTVEPAIGGETLDHLCWRTLGSADAIEQVLALNPRLTSVVLPEGAEVILPARSPSPRMLETVQLWS